MPKFLEFNNRLQYLLSGRDKHPWGAAIGLNKGTIDGMTRTGSTPGGESLRMIHRCENVSLDWLLEGRGAPFIVTAYPPNGEAEQILEEWLQDPTWALTLVTDGARYAVILDQPRIFSVKDGKDLSGEPQYRGIPYRKVEILVGAVGPLTMERLRLEAPKRAIRLVEVPSEVLGQLHTGKLGSYKLWGAPDATLAGAKLIDGTHPIFDVVALPELDPVTPKESLFIRKVRGMSEENQRALGIVVAALAK